MDQLINNRKIRVPGDLEEKLRDKYFKNADCTLEREMEFLFNVINNNYKKSKDNVDIKIKNNIE